MTPTNTRTDDAAIAADTARLAGELLLALRDRPPADAVQDARALGRLGDSEANRLILSSLRVLRPGDAILSEESADDLARVDADRVWIVDPLDGTREFSGRERSDWAVHIALWERGRGITAAAVAAPAQGVVATAAAPGPRPAARKPGPLRILVSASRPPREAEHVAERLGAELVPMGSAGAKTLAVLAGEADAYLHAGGQWEWDSAAPVGVAQAAGLHTSRIDGSPLYYNQPHPYLPDLLICDATVAGPILDALAETAAVR